MPADDFDDKIDQLAAWITSAQGALAKAIELIKTERALRESAEVALAVTERQLAALRAETPSLRLH